MLKNIRYGREKDQLVYTAELDYMPESDAKDQYCSEGLKDCNKLIASVKSLADRSEVLRNATRQHVSCKQQQQQNNGRDDVFTLISVVYPV